MSLSQIDDRECPPAAFAGPTRGAGALLGHARDRKDRSRTGTPSSGSTEGVLSARDFERSLGRECSLADRGMRRFSLLVLRRRAGGLEARFGPELLARLGSQVRQRLRSTDLVAGIDAGCLEILLTDTEPAGAHVVALWVVQLGAILGLDLELMIHVYPRVIEPSAGRLDRRVRR
jgi:hypothetical protein